MHKQFSEVRSEKLSNLCNELYFDLVWKVVCNEW